MLPPIRGESMEWLLVRAKSAEHTFMVVVAVVIGCLGGLGAVGFRYLIEVIQRVAWGARMVSLELLASHPWWWILFVPAVGGLVVGPLVHFLAPEAKGHGVPEVMEAVAVRSGFIRPRLVVVKSLASAICIGTGGSVGREGPIVQIGSALGSSVGQALRVSGSRLRTLAGCGAAAGIAATFNAPIAGALFAVEIILGDFAVTQFSPIVISSVIATVISRHFLGDFPAFEVPAYEMVSAWELVFYVVLGLTAAVVAQAFIQILYRFEDFFEAIPLRPWLLTPVGGLLVGGMALLFPQVLGVGYEAINQALSGELVLGTLLALVAAKLLATSITIGTGGSGGIFAPSLFLGAMCGGAVGALANLVFPAASATSGAYALVGMGAVVAGTTHAPITAILIIFELTSDYKLIVPLMASCIIASLITSRWRRESIYTLKLLRRGIDIFRGREINILQSLRVAEVMEAGRVSVPPGEPVASLLGRVSETTDSFFYVADGEGRLQGVIALRDLRNLLLDIDSLAGLAVAADVARQDVPVVTPEQDLDVVMRIFGGKDRDELPVVDSKESRRLLGVVNRRHLLEAYDRELMKRDMVAGLSGSVAATATEEVDLGGEFRMVEIEAPGQFEGRNLGELEVRGRFGVQVLLIRRLATAADGDTVEVVPGPETTVERGDRWVVVGRMEDLDRLRVL